LGLSVAGVLFGPGMRRNYKPTLTKVYPIFIKVKILSGFYEQSATYIYSIITTLEMLIRYEIDFSGHFFAVILGHLLIAER